MKQYKPYINKLKIEFNLNRIKKLRLDPIIRELLGEIDKSLIKKSAKKQDLISTLLNHPNKIRSYIMEKEWLCWNPIYKQKEDYIYELIYQTSNVLGLWVTFAFSEVK